MMMIMMTVMMKKKSVKYRLRFIDSYRLMSDKLSNLVDNLSIIYDMECKKKKKKNIERKIRAKSKFIRFRNDRLRHKCEECRNKF